MRIASPKTILRISRWLWLLIVAAFVGSYIINNCTSVSDTLRLVPAASILWALLSLAVAKVLLARNMYLSIRLFQQRLPFRQCLYIYSITQLGKYIPGGVWHFIGRIEMCHRAGLSSRVIGMGLSLEMATLALGAFAFGAPVTFITNPAFIREHVIAHLVSHQGVVIAVLVTIFPAALAVTIRKRKQVKALLAGWKNDPRTMAELVGVGVLIWIFLGASFVISVGPFVSSEPFVLLYFSGLYALAFMVGFLVPFAPAGIGVREAVLVLGMSSYLAPEVSLVVVGVHRMLYLIVECCLVLATCLQTRVTASTRLASG